MGLCSLRIGVFFPFLGERSGWRRPPAERSALQYHTHIAAHVAVSSTYWVALRTPPATEAAYAFSRCCLVLL